MADVTYILGAGASCNALPVVRNMPQRMREHMSYLHKITLNRELLQVGTYARHSNEILLDYTKEIEKYISILERQSSFDTYAKKLYLKRDNKRLNHLKAHLALFFIIEQVLKPTDFRYDSFWASVLKNDPKKIPDNIKVLSWNYDFQLEKSYSSFNDIETVEFSRAHLKINSKSIKPVAYNYSPPGHKFEFIKLNGTTSFYSSNNRESYDEIHDFIFNDESEFLNYILQQYYYLVNPGRTDLLTQLSFAWENENNIGNNIIEKAIDISADTETLIVIGYSFPYFNREIDKEILTSMQFLKRIYIQDLNPNPIITRLKTFKLKEMLGRDIEIIPWTDIDQFLIPDELD